jgi:hypothetical protein
MYYVNLYNNISMHESLGHELRTKMHTNTIEIILLLFVYSSFHSFVALFHQSKSLKSTNLF